MDEIEEADQRKGGGGGPAQGGEAFPVEEARRQGAHIGGDHVGLDQGIPQDRANGPVVQRIMGHKDQCPRDRDTDQGGNGRDPAQGRLPVTGDQGGPDGLGEKPQDDRRAHDHQDGDAGFEAQRILRDQVNDLTGSHDQHGGERHGANQDEVEHAPDRPFKSKAVFLIDSRQGGQHRAGQRDRQEERRPSKPFRQSIPADGLEVAQFGHQHGVAVAVNGDEDRRGQERHPLPGQGPDRRP